MQSDIIKQLRVAKDMGQLDLAEALGVSQQTVSTWENGTRTPSKKYVSEMAKLFNVHTDYILSGKQPVVAVIKIPVIGEIRAGQPIYAVQNIIDYEEISPDMTGDYFALRVRGDSMAPRIIEGDTVICEKGAAYNSGDVCVVLIDGENATLKKVEMKPFGIMLVPFNSAYEPQYYTVAEISELPVSVIGKVIELRGRL